jgi:glycosyltransferase involved in cell wall biosynthesis
VKDVLIDVYKAKDIFTGLGQFTLNYIDALKSVGLPDINITLLTPPRFKSRNEIGFDLIEAGFRHRYLPSLNRKFDLWHSLQQFPSHFPNKNTRQILTVHDLNFLVEKSERKAEKYLKKLQKNIDRADAITAISNSTKRELEKNIDLKGKPVKTIYNGVKLEINKTARRPDYVRKDKYFFAIGVFREKKNFEVLLPMMKYFEDHQLIIAGDNEGDYGNLMRRRVESLGLSEKVVLPGKVDDDEKGWLYANCEALLVPSLAEGFGLPVIEAMMAGRPVFLNDIETLREIGGGAANYFTSFGENEMADQVKVKNADYYANQTQESARIIAYASKFNWKHCIEEYLQLYLDVMGG